MNINLAKHLYTSTEYVTPYYWRSCKNPVPYSTESSNCSRHIVQAGALLHSISDLPFI